MKIKIFAIIALIAILALPLTTMGHVAFKPIKIGDKSYFEIKPGETTIYEILLKNTADTPIDTQVYATDGTITDSGTFTVLNKERPQIGIGKWTTFVDKGPIHLEGKEEKKIQLSITVPPDSTPGVYSGGLSAEPILDSSIQKTAVGAIVSTRVVFPMYVKVTGEKITKYSWDTFTYYFNKKHSFQVIFINSGNTIVKIKGTLEITDIFNNTYSIPIQDITLLRDAETAAQTSWDKKPLWGIFKAKASFVFQELDIQKNTFIEIGSQTREIQFIVIPWIIIFIIVTLIFTILFIRTLRRKAFRQYLKKCEKYTIQQGDSLLTIAGKHNIGWKKLAKINNIKPPFELTAGQIILVPPLK